ncbi:hypothetical protein F5B19DRAFT_394475 [Rostrohypoxylon terebratum]|nr:hypothetical protein F5B19DRAFT_394475 [Rostrohypoxylon terebratum]
MNILLVRELVALLHQDGTLMSDISAAMLKEDIGLEKMRNRFRKLLRRYAGDLKSEALNNSHRAVAGFIKSFATHTTQEVFSDISKGDQIRLPSPTQNVPNNRDKVNDYLQNRLNDVEPIESYDDSDQDSLDEDDEENPYDDAPSHIDQWGQFITGAIAYKTLRRRLHEFVYPSLGSKLRNLLELWSRHEHKYHDYVARYRLSNLAAELQYTNPHEIQFDTARKTSYFGHCQGTLERWTGERWDWSPLPRHVTPKDGEAGIRWECACGEMRYAEVPVAFIKRLQSIIHSLPRASQSSTTAFLESSSGTTSTTNNTSQINPSKSAQRHQQSVGSPSINVAQSGSQRQVVVSNITPPSHHILFVVQKGVDYKIAQIVVNNLCCHEFFCKLRDDYFHLRGFIRAWFSIWRYSHCDFYMCEKFDEYQFTPKKRNSYPETTDTEYEFKPRPMDFIPPISEHEFTKRFYACHKPRPLSHWYHKCKTLGYHSYDVLDLLPKKRKRLEEAGNKREYFWGIYAREMISLRWVLAYNIVCVLPTIVFFFLKLLPWGYATDLQNPSVPFTMMLSMLSLFWATFLSSLQFGRSTI